MQTGEVALKIYRLARMNTAGYIYADPYTKKWLHFEMWIVNKQCLLLRSGWGFMGVSTKKKLTCNNRDYVPFQLEASTNPQELSEYYIKGK